MSAKILTDISDTTHPNSTVSCRVWDLYVDNNLNIGSGLNPISFATRGICRSVLLGFGIGPLEDAVEFDNPIYSNPDADITYSAPEFVIDYNGFVRIQFNGYVDTENVAKNGVTLRIKKNGNLEKLVSGSGVGGVDPNFYVCMSADVTLPVIFGDAITITIVSDLGGGLLESGASVFLTKIFP